jgi:hypothetical protein
MGAQNAYEAYHNGTSGTVRGYALQSWATATGITTSRMNEADADVASQSIHSAESHAMYGTHTSNAAQSSASRASNRT